MFLSRRISLGSLIELCRAMRNYLSAGVMARDAFRQQAVLGTPGVRAVAGRIASELEQGHNLQHALEREAGAFPPMFVSLVGVGEETGNLPEVFGELERYFVRLQSLRRRFLAGIAWPILTFTIAILIVAGFILVLGLLPVAMMPNGKDRYDPLGLGLFGVSGALTFLGCVAAFFVGLYLLYVLVTSVLRRGALVAKVLLKVPVLGRCLRAMALARFCMALRMTLESGMPVRQALALSLRATGNDAFVAQTATVQTAVRKGDELSMALGRAGIFPSDFLHILAVAETSGRFDDVLENQAENYNHEVSWRLTALTLAAIVLVFLFVGGMIILVIFRIFLTYLNILDQLLQGI
jgi:type IV pilus assembly protein PilC